MFSVSLSKGGTAFKRWNCKREVKGGTAKGKFFFGGKITLEASHLALSKFKENLPDTFLL